MQCSLPILLYYGLAAGFLTGKYQPGVEVNSDRAEGVARLFTADGWATLKRLERVASEAQATLASTALAWLREQSVFTVPIASARTIEQLGPLMKIVRLDQEQITYLSGN